MALKVEGTLSSFHRRCCLAPVLSRIFQMSFGRGISWHQALEAATTILPSCRGSAERAAMKRRHLSSTGKHSITPTVPGDTSSLNTLPYRYSIDEVWKFVGMPHCNSLMKQQQQQQQQQRQSRPCSSQGFDPSDRPPAKDERPRGLLHSHYTHFHIYRHLSSSTCCMIAMSSRHFTP